MNKALEALGKLFVGNGGSFRFAMVVVGAMGIASQLMDNGTAERALNKYMDNIGSTSGEKLEENETPELEG